MRRICCLSNTSSSNCAPSGPPPQQQQQLRAPLLDAVLERGSRAHEVPLHVPGHKRGRAVDAGMQRLLAPHDDPAPGPLGPTAGNALRYDLTELTGLDYLSSPSGVIQEAQQLAAAACGADATWFLVNGCTAGIHAAVMAATQPGQALLLARNCHLSAFAACVLADCVPVWLQPEQDQVHGVAHCVTPGELLAGFEAARRRGLAVAAVLVVSPTYYGAVARIPELADLCHAEGVPLLVDEAHGGHLGFLPRDAATPLGAAGALAAGADVVLHSSHKVLTAMTQAAMLHLHGGRVAASKISRALQLLQTSSPSYILLSSLDAARRHATGCGAWTTPLAAAAAARAGLQRLARLSLLQAGSCGSKESVRGFDPLRVVVNVSGRGWRGFDAAAWLECEHGIMPEMASTQLVVFVFGPGSAMTDAEGLVAACSRLPVHKACKAAVASTAVDAAAADAAGGGARKGFLRPAPSIAPPAPGAAVLTPRQAFHADSEAVPLHAAVGRVSAELLCPYPPGVPVVFPGERLTGSAVSLLQHTLAAGGTVTGGHDSGLRRVLVVKM